MTRIGFKWAHGPVAPLARMCDNVAHNLGSSPVCMPSIGQDQPLDLRCAVDHRWRLVSETARSGVAAHYRKADQCHRY
jgi:hypothetical protein